MKKVFFFLLFFSCGPSSELGNTDFTQHVDSNNLRIFGKEDVSIEFLNKVAQSYGAMFEETSKIDASMRSKYLSISKNENVYQRVGLEKSYEKNERYADGFPSRPYRHNVTDYIWEMNIGGKDQVGEVIEHLLHTVTTVILNLSYPNDWGYMNSSSRLSLAMQEAVDKGIYDISSYEEMKGDKEAYRKVITQEYAYWLILAEWDYYITAGKKEVGISGNEEFTLGIPIDIESNLPLGHQLYVDYVEKILSVPDKNLITSLFE